MAKFYRLIKYARIKDTLFNFWIFIIRIKVELNSEKVNRRMETVCPQHVEIGTELFKSADLLMFLY